jgi:N-acetylglutamate synthase-like GNAT family acetyltransferase
MVRLRRATGRDARAIRALIRQVGINPLGLDWRRFPVAVNDVDEMIGCGQIKPHGDGTRELASIAVRPEYQNQGVGQAVIQQLLAENHLPLYLTCRAELEPYYQKFGFRSLAPEEMPPYFRRIWQLVIILRRMGARMELKVMIITQLALILFASYGHLYHLVRSIPALIN